MNENHVGGRAGISTNVAAVVVVVVLAAVIQAVVVAVTLPLAREEKGTTSCRPMQTSTHLRSKILIL